MSSATRDGAAGPGSVKDTAREVLSLGFREAGGVHPVIRSEAPLKLVYALRAAKAERWQLEAFAFAIRDAGEKAPFEPAAAVAKEQLQALQGVAREKTLPAPLKELLDEATPLLKKREDLYAFYGMLLTMQEKWDRVESIQALERG